MTRPARPAVISAEELAEIGQAMFGTAQWHRALAAELGVSERNMRYYVKGERVIHAGMARRLAEACKARGDALNSKAFEILSRAGEPRQVDE